MTLLKVCNLCKTYQSGAEEVKALDHVSFSVEKGEFVSVIGPSGSGKSTLLHILAGIERPTSGKVFVDHEDLYSMSEKELACYRRRKAGLIYQFYNLVPTLTAAENITLPCRARQEKNGSRSSCAITCRAWPFRPEKSFAEPAFRRQQQPLRDRTRFIYKTIAHARG